MRHLTNARRGAGTWTAVLRSLPASEGLGVVLALAPDSRFLPVQMLEDSNAGPCHPRASLGRGSQLQPRLVLAVAGVGE